MADHEIERAGRERRLADREVADVHRDQITVGEPEGRHIGEAVGDLARGVVDADEGRPGESSGEADQVAATPATEFEHPARVGDSGLQPQQPGHGAEPVGMGGAEREVVVPETVVLGEVARRPISPGVVELGVRVHRTTSVRACGRAPTPRPGARIGTIRPWRTLGTR